MKTELIKWLVSCETDVNGALRRFSHNEALYVMYLKNFPDEPTMKSLEKAILERNWEEAFTYGHSLKGLAGNLGFVPLYHTTAELVLLLRDKRIEDVEAAYSEVKTCYDEVVIAINKGMESIQ